MNLRRLYYQSSIVYICIFKAYHIIMIRKLSFKFDSVKMTLIINLNSFEVDENGYPTYNLNNAL